VVGLFGEQVRVTHNNTAGRLWSLFGAIEHSLDCTSYFVPDAIFQYAFVTL